MLHGRSVEHEVEKTLGILDKRRIEKEVGIAKFVALCRDSVMSKSLGNVLDPYAVFDKVGADALRWAGRRGTSRG